MQDDSSDAGVPEPPPPHADTTPAAEEEESEVGHEVAPQRPSNVEPPVAFYANLPTTESALADNVASDVRRAPSSVRGPTEEINAGAEASTFEALLEENTEPTIAGSGHRPGTGADTAVSISTETENVVDANVAARKPSHGIQVDADAEALPTHQAMKMPSTTAPATEPSEPTGIGSAAHRRAKAPPSMKAAPPRWSLPPQSAMGTVEVTVTLLPMQAVARVCVPVRNRSLIPASGNASVSAEAEEKGEDMGEAVPDRPASSTSRDEEEDEEKEPAAPSVQWLLTAKDLFEHVASYLMVHPEMFNLFHQRRRLRFTDTLLLDGDLTSTTEETEKDEEGEKRAPAPPTENTHAEAMWVSVTFPDGTEAAEEERTNRTTDSTAEDVVEEEIRSSLAGVPPHLSCLCPEDFLARCVRVHRTRLEVAPNTLLEGRRRGYSYEEVIQQMQSRHDSLREQGVGMEEGGLMVVAVVQSGPIPPVKPFLGGYRDKRDPDKRRLHASTQLHLRDLDPAAAAAAAAKEGLKTMSNHLSRQTQTIGTARGCQTHREVCAQTPRVDLMLDNSHDYIVVARPYFCAAAVLELRSEKVVVIQKLYRQWKARKIRAQLQANRVIVQRRAEVLRKREAMDAAAAGSAEQQSLATVQRSDGISQAAADVAVWKEAEAARIESDGAMAPEDARAAMLATSQKELLLLQKLEQHRRETSKVRLENAFVRKLDRMAAPKMCGGLLMATPESERARELRDLYARLVRTRTACATGTVGPQTVSAAASTRSVSPSASACVGGPQRGATGSPMAQSARSRRTTAASMGATNHSAAATASVGGDGGSFEEAGDPGVGRTSSGEEGLMTVTDARLDILLRVKWTVREFSPDSAFARELSQLIDREADLLHRGRKDASLAGLRKRIQALFAQFIEDPVFNPIAKEFARTAVGRARVKALEEGEKAATQGKSRRSLV